jgi:hypothetical protein
MLYRFGSTAFARSERKQIVTESLLHALDRIKRRRVIRLVERKPDHAGRIHIGAINALFMTAGGDAPEYSAAAKAAIDRGYMIRRAGICRSPKPRFVRSHGGLLRRWSPSA